MKKLGNLWANAKNKAAAKAGYALLLIAPVVMATSCKKEATCDYESNQYNDSKEVAASDSVALTNYKATAPQLFLGMVSAYMDQGQSEGQAWESALNNALTNPNASAELRAWATNYKNCLDKFNASVANRKSTYNAWQECEASK